MRAKARGMFVIAAVVAVLVIRRSRLPERGCRTVFRATRRRRRRPPRR